MNRPNVEYVTCALIDEHNTGDTFTDWPLHITLVPWFLLNDITKFKNDLTDILQDDHQIQVAVDEERVWGPNTVNIIAYDRSLHDIHERMISLAETAGRVLVNKQYTGENYTPHITHQKSLSKQPGDLIIIKYVYVIERNSTTKQKKIIGKIPIGT